MNTDAHCSRECSSHPGVQALIVAWKNAGPWARAHLLSHLSLIVETSNLLDRIVEEEWLAQCGELHAKASRLGAELHELVSGTSDGYVIRYVITHKNHEGLRVMSFAHQARNTYPTEQEAEIALSDYLNNRGNRLWDVFGQQAIGTFEVRPVRCWPHTHDPQTRYFDEEEVVGHE